MGLALGASISWRNMSLVYEVAWSCSSEHPGHVSSGSRAGTLPPDREPVKGVERGDHGHAEDW